MISACATLSFYFIPPLSPFPPSSRNVSLSYQPPHSVIIPSSHLLPPFHSPSFSPFPSIVSLIVSCLSPRLSILRLRFPFSSFDFPSLSPRRTRISPLPRYFPHQAALSIAFSPSFSRLSVSFTPFRYAPLIVRACHASPR